MNEEEFKNGKEPVMPIKLFITVPSNRDWKPQFALSLINLIMYVQAKGINGKQAQINLHALMQASLIPKARQMGVDAAIEDNADLILMLDDDMQFSFDLVDKLAAHGKDFVAAPYVMKGNWQPTVKDLEGNVISNGQGLVEVESIGLGCALVRMDAIKHIPRPHFSVEYLPNTHEYMGEDISFCRRLQFRGVKIFADYDCKVGHVGDFVYQELPKKE